MAITIAQKKHNIILYFTTEKCGCHVYNWIQLKIKDEIHKKNCELKLNWCPQTSNILQQRWIIPWYSVNGLWLKQLDAKNWNSLPEWMRSTSEVLMTSVYRSPALLSARTLTGLWHRSRRHAWWLVMSSPPWPWAVHAGLALRNMTSCSTDKGLYITWGRMAGNR